MLRVMTFGALMALVPIQASDSHGTSAMAWPRIVMFYGGELGNERRVLTRHEDVIRFMDAVAAPTAAASRSGPYLEVALYWHNPTWEPYADSTKFAALPLPMVPWLGTSGPNVNGPGFIQPARLYLGTSTSPPVFDWFSAEANPGPRSLGAEGIEILRQLDVPIRQ